MKMNFFTRSNLTLLSGALLLCGGVAHAQLGARSVSGLEAQTDSQQPLPLAQAFPFYVRAISPGRYEVVWNLPQGHYLYRHAFDFTLSQQGDSEELEVDFVLPEGLKKTDQFFGAIEAYYGQLDVPLRLNTVPGPDARILIYYQGCADWGFCYPPQRFEFLLDP
ncbi:MAG: protein-disulfide reductase DsbD N-terminal domain-containing protein [Pseudohongiellaceae bacterium]